MKQRTTAFKEEIKTIGKQQEVQITFGDLIIDSENINSVNYSYDGSLLKSVMKQLNIDSNINIPINAEIGLKYGLFVNGTYDFLDFGKFIVTEVEKKEDTNSYSITCYDKLLYTMKNYENIGIVYPITIQEYLQRMCAYLGLTFANSNDVFVNYNKIIPSELYLDSEGENLGYTFRDVFDEIAQVTGSVICINKNDEVEVRYINDTNDTINEEYFKNINVNFGKKYGPINSIVLSRAGESDNIYLRDEESIETNGLTELKIIDNQIMNFNNRDEFLPELLNKLNGLEYYLNDFSSTGICYYDLLDRYNVTIGENTYSCIMLNDEINITQGLEENIYTEAPEVSQTDYTKADKTDRKINQTYLIVDKQNQKIESVISQTTEQNQKIAKVTQTVEELNSKISDIADITISGEDNDAMVEFTNINQSEPIRIVVRPIIENISFLYPANNLYPSDTLYPKSRIIRFENTKTNEIFDYELPNDLLYYDSENYDEFILDYDGQSCIVNKRIGYNADGTTYILDKETTIEYEYPRILLTDGDYKVSVLGYNTAYIFVRLMAQNIYTTQFATKAEVASEISQTASEINLNVDKKLTNYSTTTQMNSAINISANSITNIVSQTYATKGELNTAKSEIKQTTDSITSTVSKKIGSNEVVSSINQSAEQITLNSNRLVVNSNNLKVDKYGNLTATNANISGTINSSNANITGGQISLVTDGYLNQRIKITDSSSGKELKLFSDQMSITDNSNGLLTLLTLDDLSLISDGGYTNVSSTEIRTPKVTQTSLESEKKNFEKLGNALEEVLKTDIYLYNLKFQKDNSKKNIGFVIGDKYNYSNLITEIDESGKEIGVNIYSMVSLLWKAVQEQQNQIEELKNEINKLKEEKINE